MATSRNLPMRVLLSAGVATTPVVFASVTGFGLLNWDDQAVILDNRR
ncbi:MAG: hypothetical protein R2712_04305 [Vicinamibacterales bacterium]